MNTAPDNGVSRKPGAKPHGGLLLNRLESCILSGALTDAERRTLADRHIWSKLDLPERARWAETALMAEDADTALAVLSSIVREDRRNEGHWRRMLELLALLGRGRALAAALSTARRHLGPDFGKDLPFYAVPGEGGPQERDLASAAAPFEARSRHHAAISRFLSLFSGREDCFARQWADRAEKRQGYVPVNAALGPAEIEEHLAGRKTYGIYLLRQDGTVTTALIDADLRPDYRKGRPDAGRRRQVRRESVWLASRVRELSGERGAAPLVEVSGGKGYHFWYFFPAPVAAADVRTALAGICADIGSDLEAFGLEVFPKQDRLTGKGYGNLVKLPLGVHRLSGRRSYFPACQNRSVAAQLAFLETAATVDPAAFLKPREQGSAAQVIVHPRLAPWAESHPELHRLRERCPPLSQIMALCVDREAVSLKEEKVLYQTVGFLDRGREYLHHLLGRGRDYDPHLVDFRLSRRRGAPLGCRRIHRLLGFNGPLCCFTRRHAYPTPLLHIDDWTPAASPASERAEDLKGALSALRTAIGQVERFMVE